MPDATITAPVAAGSIDRLALGATDARAFGGAVLPGGGPNWNLPEMCFCMAEE